MDRSYVSELVYGPVLRSGSRLTTSQRDQLTDVVHRHGGVLIHVYASVEQIEERLARRSEVLPSRSRLQAILDGYESVFAELAGRASVLRRDTTG